MREELKKYMPSHVNLYYVDYRDDLRDHSELLQKCVDQNSLNPISEKVFNWWDYPEGDYINDIEGQMRKDGLEISEEDRDEIWDYLNEHDESCPVEDLIHNTGQVTCYYDLGLECDCGWHEAILAEPWMNEMPEDCAKKVCEMLGIDKGSDTAKKIKSVCLNATRGGYLRIYFPAYIDCLVSGERYEKYWEASDKDDFQQIRFKGKFAVAVYNSCEGAGDYECIELDCTFPFLRDNLAISKTDKYSIESCFDMAGDWLCSCDTPDLSTEPLDDKARAIEESSAGELRALEAEYEATFKAGGCTPGDMDIRRHRDVYYRNDFPCGHVCPHCGTFWID